MDDRLLFCAGAALAAAGLDKMAPAERAAFDAGVTGHDGMATLYGTIARLGWDQDFCLTMIRDNDRAATGERKSAMIERLREAMTAAPA